MLLSISNLTNGLRGLKYNDDVPIHKFQAADREPQTTRWCRCRNELIFYANTYLLQKYQQSKAEYRVYSARLMAGGVILHKANFLCKKGGEARLMEPFKGDKKTISLALIIFWYPPNLYRLNLPTRITPSIPEEVSLKHTSLTCQVLRLGYSTLWSLNPFPSRP